MERVKNYRRMRGRSILLMALLLTLLPWAGTVYAANFTVTKTADTNDGVCDADCSLREAITAAANGDTITVPAGTYNLSLGDLNVLVSVAINGSGAGSTIINQTQPGQRVFETAAADVNISRVTIQGGQADASSVVPGHLHGGGLHNHGVVTLTNVTFTGNSALNVDPTNPTSGTGGAIWNAGTMTLINITIANNTAAVSGGGIGGVSPTLTNTIVANNTGGNCTATITITGSNNLQFPGTTCAGAITTADPLLGPLTDGVYPLLAGSPAIDTGTNTGCPPTDELGTARPQGAACDIGAFEFVPAPPPTAPMCNGQTATIYVNDQGIIVGGPNNGQPYAGNLNGMAGVDVIVGTNGRDEISARGGNDVVCGRGNNDKLFGGEGRDQLFGGEGHDQLFGGDGNDILAGDGGNDTLTGGRGADRFRGGSGTDTATDFNPAQGDTKTGVP
jgi:CSLREA domain-containing protein